MSDTAKPICPFCTRPPPSFSLILRQPPAACLHALSHLTDGSVSKFPPKHEPGWSCCAHLHVLK